MDHASGRVTTCAVGVSGTETLSPRAVDNGADGPRCLAVMYHYVRSADPLLPGSFPALSLEEFTAQLDQLCATMEPIDWPRLFAWTQQRAALPARCFLLTFDDGLADHYRHVVPLLTARGLHGVFFVPGVVLTGQRLLSAHAIHLLLATLGDEEFIAEISQCLDAQAPDANWWGRVNEAAARALYHYETPLRGRLKYLLTMTLPIPLREAVVAELFGRHIGSPVRWARQWYVQWEQLKEMESLGHTVGGHGFAHESYARLAADEVRQDIAHVGAVLRQGLGPDIRPFSFPYGGVTDLALDVCRQAGFVHAFTTQSRWIAAPVDAFRLPRVDTIAVAAELTKEGRCPQK